MAVPLQHAFQYTPLTDCPRPNCPRSIRLLELLPGHPNSAIKANLINTTLTYHQSHETWYQPCEAPSRPHSFMALSYEWGDPGCTQTIVINDQPFIVRHNINQFLKQIRAQWSHRLPLMIWADAICINQNDFEEKSKQVRMMHKIYAQAEEVLVWLGEEADASTPVMQRLCQWTDDMVEGDDELSFGNKKSYMGRTGNIRAIMRNVGRHYASMPNLLAQVFGVDEDARSAFLKLCRRSYWSRAWIIQELLLAKEVSLFCGLEHTTHDVFPLLGPLVEQSQKCLGSADSESASLLDEHEESSADKVYSSFDPGTRVSELTRRWRIRRHDGLESLLRSYTGSRCSDPHDKVYAFLGLCSDTSEFPIDYTCPLATLIAQAVTFCSDSKSRLDDHETDPIKKTSDSINLAQLLLHDLGLDATSHEQYPEASTLDKALSHSAEPFVIWDCSEIPVSLLNRPVTIELDYQGRIRSIIATPSTCASYLFTINRRICTTLTQTPVRPFDRVFSLRGTRLMLVYRRTLTRLHFITTAVICSTAIIAEETPLTAHIGPDASSNDLLARLTSTTIPSFRFPVPYDMPIYSLRHSPSLLARTLRRLLQLPPKALQLWLTTRTPDGYYASPYFHLSLRDVLRIVRIEPQQYGSYDAYVRDVQHAPKESLYMRAWTNLREFGVRIMNSVVT